MPCEIDETGVTCAYYVKRPFFHLCGLPPEHAGSHVCVYCQLGFTEAVPLEAM